MKRRAPPARRSETREVSEWGCEERRNIGYIRRPFSENCPYLGVAGFRGEPQPWRGSSVPFCLRFLLSIWALTLSPSPSPSLPCSWARELALQGSWKCSLYLWLLQTTSWPLVHVVMALWLSKWVGWMRWFAKASCRVCGLRKMILRNFLLGFSVSPVSSTNQTGKKKEMALRYAWSSDYMEYLMAKEKKSVNTLLPLNHELRDFPLWISHGMAAPVVSCSHGSDGSMKTLKLKVMRASLINCSSVIARMVQNVSPMFHYGTKA